MSAQKKEQPCPFRERGGIQGGVWVCLRGRSFLRVFETPSGRARGTELSPAILESSLRCRTPPLKQTASQSAGGCPKSCGCGCCRGVVAVRCVIYKSVVSVCRCGAVQRSLNVCSPRRARRDCVMRTRAEKHAVAVVPTCYTTDDARSKLQRCNSQRCTPASGSIPSSSQFSAKSAWLTIAYECRPVPAVSKVKCVSIKKEFPEAVGVLSIWARRVFNHPLCTHPGTSTNVQSVLSATFYIAHAHTCARTRADTQYIHSIRTTEGTGVQSS